MKLMITNDVKYKAEHALYKFHLYHNLNKIIKAKYLNTNQPEIYTKYIIKLF